MGGVGFQGLFTVYWRVLSVAGRWTIGLHGHGAMVDVQLYQV